MKRKLTVDAIIALLFIFLFVFTAISKFRDLPQFRGVLYKSELTYPYYRFLAYAIPVGELSISALLFFRHTRTAGLVLSALLMATFTWYVAYVLNNYKELPCTCGGVINSLSWSQHLIFNSVLTALAFFALYVVIRAYRKQN